jgi:hypothetical protein
MKHAGGFNKHEQPLGLWHVRFELRQQLGQSGRAHRQILFKEQTLPAIAQDGPYFVFCDIDAQEVDLFH